IALAEKASTVGQIRLADDRGYGHLKLKLEQSGLLGPIVRLCASCHLIAGGVKPDNCIRLHERQYNQSLLSIDLDGTNELHLNCYRCGVYPRCARGLPSFHPFTD